MIVAPAPDEGLVRRCAIAALALTFGEPAPRTVRSPAFARRVDAALANADPDVPAAVREAAATRLEELGLTLPTAAPEPRQPVAARTLRVIRDGLAWAREHSAEAAERLVESALLGARDEGSLERIAASYRAQGATAREVVVTIALEFGLAPIDAIVAVAAALDRAGALLGTTWEPADLQLAFARELLPQPGTAAPAPQAPQIVAPEPRRPLPGRRRHFSASSLNLYADCARKWYFKYLCGAVEDKGSSASTYGTAFHAALESFHRKYPKIVGIPAQELISRLESEINVAFERYRIGFTSEVEYRLNRRRALRTARKYLSWLQERAKKEPFEVIGCEVEANVTLDGFEFRGYIDRIDRDERSGRVTVFDYKTGAIATSAAEYRAMINAAEEFQLPYYFWAQTESGATVRSLALVPLRDAHLDVDPIELEIVPVAAAPARVDRDATRGVISIGELERSRARMIELSQMLASGTIERYAATDDPASCRYCVYAPSCRQKPPDDEQAFGR